MAHRIFIGLSSRSRARSSDDHLALIVDSARRYPSSVLDEAHVFSSPRAVEFLSRRAFLQAARLCLYLLRPVSSPLREDPMMRLLMRLLRLFCLLSFLVAGVAQAGPKSGSSFGGLSGFRSSSGSASRGLLSATGSHCRQGQAGVKRSRPDRCRYVDRRRAS